MEIIMAQQRQNVPFLNCQSLNKMALSHKLRNFDTCKYKFDRWLQIFRKMLCQTIKTKSKYNNDLKHTID